MPSPWISRACTFAVWALVAWSGVWWWSRLQGLSSAGAVPPTLGSGSAEDGDPAAVARLFGPPVAAAAPQAPASAGAASAPPPEPVARLVLSGTVAAAPRRGIALLAVDGRPARPYRVGTRIEERFELRSVTPHSAVLRSVDDGREFTLQLAVPGTAALAGAPAAPATAPPAARPARAVRPPLGAASGVTARP